MNGFCIAVPDFWLSAFIMWFCGIACGCGLRDWQAQRERYRKEMRELDRMSREAWERRNGM